MYIEMNNPNQYVRDEMINEFKDYDINNDDAIIKIIEEFDYLKSSDFKLYEQTIKTLYQDYKLINLYESKRFNNAYSFDDVTEIIDMDPTFCIDLLLATFKFYNMDIIEKKRVLLKTTSVFEEMKEFNPMYIIDIMDFGKDFVKEDLLCCYYETLQIDEGTEEERKMAAIDDTMDLLYGLNESDKDNYKKVVKDVLDDGYMFLKNESDSRILKKYQYRVIDRIEHDTFNNLSESIEDNDEFLIDVLDSFIEYNKKPMEEQKKIKEKIKKRGN